MVMTIVPFLKGAAGQPCVRLRLVVVGGDQRSDGGLIDHSCRLAPPRQWAGRLVLAVASLLGRRFGSFFRDHFGVVFCHNLGHVAHRSVAHFHVVGIKAASQDVPRGEAFRNNVHEDSWDVGGAVEGEGWVKPTDLSLYNP